MECELVPVWNGTLARLAEIAETRPAPDEPPPLGSFARKIVGVMSREWQTTRTISDALGVTPNYLHKYLPMLLTWDYLERREPDERCWWGKASHQYRRGTRLLLNRTARPGHVLRRGAA